MTDAPQRDDGSPETSKYRGPERASPYAVSRLSGPVSLVDAAREIERADQWIASTSSAKLEQIAEQMHALRKQAEQVLADAQANAELHRAEARFARHPGKTYHLYERSPGQRYWSLLAPGDWRGAPPHTFVGSYRLEADQSWTPLDHIAARDRRRAPVTDWLERGLLAGGDSAPTHSAGDASPSRSGGDAASVPAVSDEPQPPQPASPATRTLEGDK